MGGAAAEKAGAILRHALEEKDDAVFIAATGTSQFEFLEALTNIECVDWSRATMFHLDEYIGVPETHPASFRRYLKERLIDKIHPGKVYLINGDSKEPEAECKRLNKIISHKVIDVAFVGIGENGHLAFNDPPADFIIEKPYIVVELDKSCRMQQVREGWFKTLDQVPVRAITMSIKQIMKSKNIICTVPDRRKAQTVKNCLDDEVSPADPASVLRKHDNVLMFIDENAAALLKGSKTNSYELIQNKAKTTF